MGMQFNKSGSLVWSLIFYQGHADVDYSYTDLKNWLESGKMKKPFERVVVPAIWNSSITESYGPIGSAWFTWSDATRPFIVYAFGASNYIY